MTLELFFKIGYKNIFKKASQRGDTRVSIAVYGNAVLCVFLSSNVLYSQPAMRSHPPRTLMHTQYAREVTELERSGQYHQVVKVWERAFSETGNLEFLRFAGEALLIGRPFEMPSPHDHAIGETYLSYVVSNEPWPILRFEALRALVASYRRHPPGTTITNDIVAKYLSLGAELEIKGLLKEAIYVYGEGYQYTKSLEVKYQLARSHFLIGAVPTSDSLLSEIIREPTAESVVAEAKILLSRARTVGEKIEETISLPISEYPRKLIQIASSEKLPEILYAAADSILRSNQGGTLANKITVEQLLKTYLKMNHTSQNRIQVEHWLKFDEWRIVPIELVIARENEQEFKWKGLGISRSCDACASMWPGVADTDDSYTHAITLPSGQYYKSHEVEVVKREGDADYKITVDRSGVVLYATVSARGHKNCYCLIVKNIGPQSAIYINIRIRTSNIPPILSPDTPTVEAIPPKVYDGETMRFVAGASGKAGMRMTNLRTHATRAITVDNDVSKYTCAAMAYELARMVGLRVSKKSEQLTFHRDDKYVYRASGGCLVE